MFMPILLRVVKYKVMIVEFFVQKSVVKGENVLENKYVKVEVLLPEAYIEKVRDALNAIGVLRVGNYDHVISYSAVKGYWRPLEGATPFNGPVGEISFGTECKMEFNCLYQNIKDVENTIRSVHPYEEPVINVVSLLN